MHGLADHGEFQFFWSSYVFLCFVLIMDCGALSTRARSHLLHCALLYLHVWTSAFVADSSERRMRTDLRRLCFFRSSYFMSHVSLGITKYEAIISLQGGRLRKVSTLRMIRRGYTQECEFVLQACRSAHESRFLNASWPVASLKSSIS